MASVAELLATKNDLLALLGNVEASTELVYVRAGMFETPEAEAYSSAGDIENFGLSETGRGVLGPIFLVVRPDAEVIIEPVPQRRGGTRYSISQRGNPASVSIKVGGDFKNEAVIASQIGTIHGDEESKALMGLYRKEIRRSFKKAGPYWLGAGAEEALYSGLRLTADITAPREVDLRVEEVGKGHPISSTGR